MKKLALIAVILIGAAISFEGVRFGLRRIESEPTASLLPWGTRVADVSPLFLGVLFYLTMLAGVLLGELFQHVTARPTEQVKLHDLLASLNTGRSWAALLASPMVFFATVPSLLALGAASIAFFYALQNGFFCLAVFNTLSAKFGRTAAR